MPHTNQNWQDQKFCREYAEQWDIDSSEVHYGWLSPGENILQLLTCLQSDNGKFDDIAVLDIGCGMGENLIALSCCGACCFGVDISTYMIEYAKKKVGKSEVLKKIELECHDMRDFKYYSGIQFDLVLSIYSMEYLQSLDEFRAMLANIFSRLKSGGRFVFCFSHPLQHSMHSRLHNISALSGDSQGATLIYSFRDVVEGLSSAGFEIERVIEQSTQNPSQLTKEEAMSFPYRFHKGKNPCQKKFDSFSNSAPHTVVYRARKPKERSKLRPIDLFAGLNAGVLRLWGQNRTVTDAQDIQVGSDMLPVYQLASKDNVVFIAPVLQKTCQTTSAKNQITVKLQSGVNRKINSSCLIGIVHKQLISMDYQPIYSSMDASSESNNPIYLVRVDPVYGKLRILYPSQEMGLLLFVNGEELLNGAVSADHYFPVKDDVIDLIYIATGWGTQWRPSEDIQQLKLFNESGGD